MSFLPKALRFDLGSMISTILAIPSSGMKTSPSYGVVWNPRGIVWHNTYQPDIGEWEHYTQAQKESFGDNLNSYYRNKMGWHSGPHIAVPPETWAYQLCDLQADGVHDSCRNSNYYGLETVVDWGPHGNDITSAFSQIALNNAAAIIAAFCKRFNWDPDENIDFHRTCAHDNHACPGVQLTNEAALSLVKNKLAQLSLIKAPPPTTSPLPPSLFHPESTPLIPTIILPEWPLIGDPFFGIGARVFNKWIALGLPKWIAEGFVANGEAECSLNVALRGDKETACGLGQWHGDRAQLIFDGCGIDVRKDPLIEHHVTAMYWELMHPEGAAMDKILKATTAEDAGIAIAVNYERAGAPQAAQRRGRMAERWATLFQNTPSLLSENPIQG